MEEITFDLRQKSIDYFGFDIYQEMEVRKMTFEEMWESLGAEQKRRIEKNTRYALDHASIENSMYSTEFRKKFYISVNRISDLKDMQRKKGFVG